MTLVSERLLQAASLLAEHSGLGELSSDQLSLITSQCKVVSFSPGQVLSKAETIPSEVHFLLSGQARLLTRHQGRLMTAEKLSAHRFAGLISLCRASGCEEVIASTSGESLLIPDQLVVDSFLTHEGFCQWLSSTLFVAEAVDLLHRLSRDQPAQSFELDHALQAFSKEGKVHALFTPNLLNGGERSVLVASNNLQLYPLASRLRSDSESPVPSPPLPLRLISLPASLVNGWMAPDPFYESNSGSGSHTSSPESTALVAPAGAIDGDPLASGLDLGSRDAPAITLLRAEGQLEELLACFQMLAGLLKLPFRRDAIEKILRDVLRRGQTPDLQLCGAISASMGLHVSAAKVASQSGTRLQVPALVPWKDGFALVQASHARGLVLASPREGLLTIPPGQLDETFPEGIDLIFFERRHTSPNQRFGFSWFAPALKRYRGILGQVFIASFVVQLFGLANPLLIQVIIDKVITQRSLDTLQVLGFALIVVTLVEGVLGALRTYLFTETTNRIDLRLGSEVIDHLLRLPLDYFDRRPVGDLGTRISELEKIRQFLTGQALSSLLDALFSLVYIAVMFIYSWLLSIVALCVLPVQIALTFIGAPLFRRQFRDTAQQNARTQSHLVEVLTGIQTVKAQNVEMVSRWKWQSLYSGFISRSFEKTVTGTALSESSQVLQKLSQLLVLWVGATLVLKGDLSLGQLIAFRIISGYVTQPLLRLSSIWQSIQELKISFERLSDVIDTPEESDESDKAKIPLPPIHGEVVFDDVCFSFSPNSPLALNHVSLDIAAGTFVGVVGQSGSGKSTLTKMLSRLYAPASGRILVDGNDIDKVELYSLRRQIGIVPQDPLLFSGTVAENIALTDPDAPSDSIVAAAKLACAHDFIMSLPGGYSANVGERGSNLSGGQRQRLALARTLLSRPRLLVLDEATSALDYDTERRVCENLLSSLENCTVFFITHRLSTIRRVDQIVMMNDGSVVEVGTHDELLALKGRYFALYQQQDES